VAARCATPRECLIAAFAAEPGEGRACAIVDALDEYLEDDGGRASVPNLGLMKVNPRTEIDKVKKERDEAIARAEKAEQSLRAPITSEERTRLEKTAKKKKKKK
jgi:hypothetical protein